MLLAGLTATLLNPAAHAKTLGAMAPQPTDIPKVAAPPPDDGLAGGGFYLEADSLTQNQITHHVVATGAVEARYKGRVLRAQSVDYDSETGVVVASGNVEILQPDGSAQFAETFTLDKTLSEGFAAGFSTRLQGDVKIAAQSADRKTGQVTEFHHVIYTPCVVCVENGQKRPTWSIRARSVVEDKTRQTLTFKGAVVEVLGLPVLYFPVLQTADPTAVRKSGLLLPTVTFSGPRGVSYEQPYYQVITPHQDLLITPQINSRVNPFLKLDFRDEFYSGTTETRLGYTYYYNFNSNGEAIGDETSHSYILGDGSFKISPTWSWGYTAELTSDKLIFQKYSVADVYTTSTSTDLGLYAADDQRLISQLYTVHQNANSYLSITSIYVQGLRSTDVQSTIPTIAPLVEGRWEAPEPVLGGRLRLFGSGVLLTQDQAMSATDTLVPGMDSLRATVQGDWQRTFRFSNGLLVQPFLNGRFDFYNVTNEPTGDSTATIPRGWGTIGANISYPLVKQVAGASYILEPLAQIAISPDTILDPRIPNEDSVDFDFDETNLFDTNRSPGYDLYEGGQSVTLAGRATVILDDGRTASLLIGRRLGAEFDPAIPLRTGLATALSDWVVGADATPWNGVRLYSRVRLDSSNLEVNELETGASFTTSRAEGSISYLYERNSPAGGPVDSLDIHTTVFATRHWGVTDYLIVDGGTWRRTEAGVVYRDDCIRVEVIYRHDETFNGTLGPSTSLLLRLTLATLGDTR